jgi:hypothetical protein
MALEEADARSASARDLTPSMKRRVMMNAAGSMIRIPSHQSGVVGTRSRAAVNQSRAVVVQWVKAKLPHPLHAVGIHAQSERAILADKIPWGRDELTVSVLEPKARF